MKTSKCSRNSSALSGYSCYSIKLDPNAMIQHSQNLQNWISSKSVLKLQEKSDLEVNASKSLVNSILEREKTIVKESVEGIINEYELNNQRRREVLNKKWNNVMFEPILQRLEPLTDDKTMDSLIQRRRDLHQDYLDYVNKKHFVSLTDYCEEEYSPYSLTSKQILPMSKSNKARISYSANPTLVEEESRLEEDRCQIRCLTGHIFGKKDLQSLRLPRVPLVPLGRQDADCISWMNMPYYQINSDIRQKCRTKMRGDFNQGSAHLCLVNQNIATRFEKEFSKSQLYA